MTSRSVRVAVVMAGFALYAGCKKDNQSLVLVSVTADSMASSLTSLTLSTTGTSQTFPLGAGLSAAAQQFGLYVPADVTGAVTISAVASGPGSCSIYAGQGPANIPSAGSTSSAQIRVTPPATCGSDGGAGSGGRAGSGGSGGVTAGTGGAGGGGASAGTGGNVGQGGAGGSAALGGSTGTGGSGGGKGGADGSGGAAGAGGSATGGATSTGGVTGTGGSGGSTSTECASTPAVGTPPLLTCCQEYDHADANCAVAAGVQGVAFSPDGTLIATAASDKHVKIWSFDGQTMTATGTVLPAPGTYVYGYTAFSPDGKYLAVGADHEVDVYSVATWTAVGPPLTIGTDQGVAFAPDSQHVISFDGEVVYVHLVGTAAALTSVSLGQLFSSFAVGTVAGPSGLVIATGGSELLSGVGSVGTGIVYLLSSQYALNSGVTLRTGTTFQVNELYASAVAPNGTSLAFGDADSQIWFSSNVPTSTTTIPESSTITVDPKNYQSVNGIAYSPKDGNYLAAAAGQDSNGKPGTVTIWNVSNKTLYAKYAGVTQQPASVAFSPNGNAIVVGESACGKVLLCTN